MLLVCKTSYTNSTVTLLTSRVENYRLQSLGHCRDQCSGSAFAITQGRSCWCSNYAPSTTIDTSSCNQPCPGYPYEVCGSTSGAYSYIQIGTPSGTGEPVVAPPSSIAPPQPIAPPQSVAPSVIFSPIVDTIVSTPPPNTVYQTVENTVVSNNVVIRTTAIVRTSVVRSSQPRA